MLAAPAAASLAAPAAASISPASAFAPAAAASKITAPVASVAEALSGAAPSAALDAVFEGAAVPASPVLGISPVGDGQARALMVAARTRGARSESRGRYVDMTQFALKSEDGRELVYQEFELRSRGRDEISSSRRMAFTVRLGDGATRTYWVREDEQGRVELPSGAERSAFESEFRYWAARLGVAL